MPLLMLHDHSPSAQTIYGIIQNKLSCGEEAAIKLFGLFAHLQPALTHSAQPHKC